MLVTTTNDLPGYHIVEHLALVRGIIEMLTYGTGVRVEQV